MPNHRWVIPSRREVLDGLIAERDAWKELSKAQDDVLICYRIRADAWRMSDALDRLIKARELVKELD